MQNPWNIFSFGWDDSILTSHRHALIVTTKMYGFLKWGISHLKGILLCMEQLNSLWASESIWTVLFSLCFRILNFLDVRVACPTWNRLGGWLKVLPTVKVKKGPFLFLNQVLEPQTPYCSFFNWSVKKKTLGKRLGLSKLPQSISEKSLLWLHLDTGPAASQSPCSPVSIHISEWFLTTTWTIWPLWVLWLPAVSYFYHKSCPGSILDACSLCQYSAQLWHHLAWQHASQSHISGSFPRSH